MRQAPNPQEIEIKLLVAASNLPRLREHPLLRDANRKSGETRQLNSVYFDDSKLSLAKRGISLRVRHIGNRRIQTLKAQNGARHRFERDEWESEISGDRPDLALAAATPLRAVLKKKLRGALEPIFETRIARTSFPVRFGKSSIEVALDHGKIHTRREAAPIAELELELRNGARADLFRLARDLNETIPLELSYRSKAARGYALVDGKSRDVAEAETLELTPEMTCAEAFRFIGHECLRHLVDNRPGVARADAEALHQMRVGIRRLRTAISLFRDVIAGPETEFIKAELRWLRRETGPARDLDVFLQEVMTPIRNQHRKERGVTSLYRHLRRRRLKSYEQAQTAIASDRFRALVWRAAEWIEGDSWLAAKEELARARQNAPIGSYAAEGLSALRRKIRKQGKQLKQLDEHRRHKLRVRIKKLRYAADFFESVFPKKKSRRRAKAFAAALKRFQDTLGALNDIAVRKSLTAEIAGKVSGNGLGEEAGRSRIFVAGLVAGHQEAHVGPLLNQAKTAYAKFRAAKPFWKSVKAEPATEALAATVAPNKKAA